ncbi:MAG: hypothetical protein LBR80_15810 [Deltaproteobacteria bacterium]|nr:hypothetical protein [Deltaproteobacteria bacterium]
MPPHGALSLTRLNASGTLCHTCVRTCPNQSWRLASEWTPAPGKPGS